MRDKENILKRKRKIEKMIERRRNSLAYMYINRREELLLILFVDFLGFLNDFNMPRRTRDMLITPFNNQHILTLFSYSLKNENEVN
jgi:hypothetical protein